MEKSIFDSVISRKNSDSIKWSRYEDGVLPLWVADMDFPSPEVVIEAVRDRLAHPFFGYYDEITGLKKSICSWLDTRHQWRVDPEEIVLMPGVVNGLNWVAQALMEDGQSLIFQTPVYHPFFKIAANASVTQIHSSLKEVRGRFEMDFQDLAVKIQDNTRLFILCNPHNPVGRVFTRQELKKLAEICENRDLWICSDEIHSDLVFPGSSHVPISTLDESIARRTITLMAPSKTFNIPGLNFSFAVVPNENLRKQLKHSRKGIIGHPGLLASYAARAAYSSGSEWLEELLIYLDENRSFVIEFLSTKMPGIKFFIPEGTYLFWLDCRQMNLESDPHQFFLQKARVALNDGKIFGVEGEGFVRLNFACPMRILDSALNRMSDAVSKWGGRL